jgi:RND family efflux transporter MFP subunit
MRKLEVLAATLLVLTLAGCEEAKLAERPLTTVRLTTVTEYQPQQGLRYSASVMPNRQVDLAFRTPGYVTSILQRRGADGVVRNIGTGDFVDKDSVLAEVRRSDYGNQVTQARAQLAQGQAQLENARLNRQRAQNLFASDSLTKPDYDAAKAQFEAATAVVQNARAAFSQASISLNDTVLRAPFPGYIVNRNIEIGALAGAGTVAFTLADLCSVKVIFGLPDYALAQVRLGQLETVTSDAMPGEFHGHVTAISPVADSRSRVFSVEVTVPNTRGRLKPGMVATLVLQGTRAPAQLAVPLSALVPSPNNPQRFSVFVAEKSGTTWQVHAREVAPGNTHGDLISIPQGLHTGEQVVSVGAALIKDGETVRVLP